MPKSFRFGVQLHALPAEGWVEQVRRIEAMGYSSIFWPDHFGPQWDPVAALAAVAAVTEKLRVGSLVYDVDYRHPVIYAKSAATIHLLSGGRHEFGLGAGWMESDYQQAGLDFDRPAVRVERLEEALKIIRAMWSEETSSFEGTHYHIREIPRAAELPEGVAPKILIGGGGRKVLGLAGRHADIVGINPTMNEGRITSRSAADLAPDRVRQKIDWVREAAQAAGRDPDDLEFNSLVFVVALTDDPKPLREGLARNTGMSVEQVGDCPLFLTGSAGEIRDRLESRREQTGINYVVIQGREPELLEAFAAGVVAPLNGT